jgi:hypothetical protein
MGKEFEEFKKFKEFKEFLGAPALEWNAVYFLDWFFGNRVRYSDSFLNSSNSLNSFLLPSGHACSS